MQKKEMIQMETENKQKISSEICRYHKMSLDITRYPKITMQRVIHEIGAFQSDLYFLNCIAKMWKVFTKFCSIVLSLYPR